MEVKEVINKRDTLKNDIISLIVKFESETSCCIDSIEYNSFRIQGYNNKYMPAIGTIKVRINFEP